MNQINGESRYGFVSALAQLTDKGISTFKMCKSFRPPFSNGGAVEAAEASSRSAERETPLSALLF